MGFAVKFGAIVFLMIVVVVTMMISDAEGETTMPYWRRRFLAENAYSKSVACNGYNNVCQKSDVAGKVKSVCCNKRCFNVLTDSYHCGNCGTICSFGYACCNGKCVNVTTNKRNCGGCNVICAKNQKCAYGMCSYGYWVPHSYHTYSIIIMRKLIFLSIIITRKLMFSPYNNYEETHDFSL